MNRSMQCCARAIVVFLLASAATAAAEWQPLKKREGAQPEPLPASAAGAPLVKKPEAPPAALDDRQGWFMGVIEPALEAKYRLGGDLEVVIVVRSDEAAFQSTQAARHRAMPGIRDLARQVRDIERAYRPAATRTRDEEKAMEPGIQASMTDADRGRRDALNREIDRRLDAMRDDVFKALERSVGGALEEMAAFVTSLGGTVEGRMLVGSALQARVPSGILLTIASHPAVAWIEDRRQGRLALDVSLPAANFSWWHGAIGTGGVFDAGLVDDGLRTNHPAFSGLTIYTDGSSTTHTDPVGHGTHVAGIIASDDATFRGTAYGIDRLFFANFSGGIAALENLMNPNLTGTLQKPDVINHSVGYGIATDTDYSDLDARPDTLVEQFDTLIAQAAGNNGASDLWSTLALDHPANAFNVITVANMDDRGTIDRSDDVRRASSSFGPTLDGRRKPDLSAPGTNIASANWQWDASGLCTVGPLTCGATGIGGYCNHDFCEISGTSMAAPHVAGAVVLLEEGGAVEAMAQKAVLINTADTWSSASTYSGADDAESTDPGWDKVYGWGYIDMLHAGTHRTDFFNGSVWPRNSPYGNDYRLYAGRMIPQDKVTLVWTKRKHLFSLGYALSDLDLYLFDEDSGDMLDSDITLPDNVQQVSAEAVVQSVVKVEAYSTAFGGASVEEFVVATEENFAPVDFPVDFAIGGQWPATMQPGTQAGFSGSVANTSGIASHRNILDLQTLPAGWSLVGGPDTQNVGSAAAGGVPVWADWTLQARAPDTTPPSPSPMTWNSTPTWEGATSLSMTATTATDLHGPIEYYFAFIGSPTGGAGGGDRGWSTSTSFTDSGLGSNHQYCYIVQARDGLPVTEHVTFTHSHTSYGETYGPTGPWSFPVQLTETPNIGWFSDDGCGYTKIETPSGVAFGAITASSIQAQSASVPDGLTRGSSGLIVHNSTAGTSSGWRQNNDLWTSSGLLPNAQYDFYAVARNGDGAGTPSSSHALARTLAAVPGPGGFTPVGDDALQVTWSSINPPAITEYMVENTTLGTSWGWDLAPSLSWISTGLACGQTYSFRVKARNADGVETAWFDLGSRVAGLDLDGDLSPDCVDLDDDNDGLSDNDDCRPADPAIWSVPGLIDGLTIVKDPMLSGRTLLSWPAPSAPGATAGLLYDTLVTGTASLWDEANATCLEQDGTDRTSVHDGDPPPGGAWFFLVRAQDSCGAGPAGISDATGTPAPRTVRSCGCGHPICETGTVLDPACDPCVATICSLDPYCCDDQWDLNCVEEVERFCGGSCS